MPRLSLHNVVLAFLRSEREDDQPRPSRSRLGPRRNRRREAGHLDAGHDSEARNRRGVRAEGEGDLVVAARLRPGNSRQAVTGAAAQEHDDHGRRHPPAGHRGPGRIWGA